MSIIMCNLDHFFNLKFLYQSKNFYEKTFITNVSGSVCREA